MGAKVATLSKENELYKKKDKETIWVSMNSMKKKPLQEKSTLWVSPQDYMDEIRQENQASSPSKKKQKQSTVGLWCHGIIVHTTYLGQIPKSKPKIAETTFKKEKSSCR